LLKETTQPSLGKLRYSFSHELLSMGNIETEPIFIPVETTVEKAFESIEMNLFIMKYISELYTAYEPLQHISKLQVENIMKNNEENFLSGLMLFLCMYLIYRAMT
jgi:hypothetical protein